MLSEINLLPEKEKRDITNIVIILILILLFFGVLQFLLTSYEKARNEVAKLEQNLLEVEIEKTKLQQQIEEEMKNDYDDLLETIEMLETFFVPASSILKQLVSLLPERGFFSSYQYTYGTSITFHAYFDVIDEVASYTYELNNVDFIKSVTVESIKAVEILENDIDFQLYGYLPRYEASFRLELDRERLFELGDEP